MLEMRRIVFNDYVDASLAALLIALVLTMGAFGLKAMRDALRSEVATTRETQDGVLQTAAA
jgi:carbon starvation protein